MNKILDKKNALITGVWFWPRLRYSRIFFFNNGCNIIISGRDLPKLKESSKKLEKLSTENKIFYFKSDVSNEQDCLDLINFAKEKFRCIDILVNNAGIHGLYGEVDKKIGINGKKLFILIYLVPSF